MKPISATIIAATCLIATIAAAQTSDPWNRAQREHTFDWQVERWRADLIAADGILIEAGGWEGSEALFLPRDRSVFETINDGAGDKNRASGRFDYREIEDLISATSQFSGYNYRCTCVDGGWARITIRHNGRAAVLRTYGPDADRSDAGTRVLQWLKLSNRLFHETGSGIEQNFLPMPPPLPGN